MQALSKALEGLLTGASYAFLLLVALVLFTFFQPLGFIAHIVTLLYILTLAFLLSKRFKTP